MAKEKVYYDDLIKMGPIESQGAAVGKLVVFRCSYKGCVRETSEVPEYEPDDWDDVPPGWRCVEVEGGHLYQCPDHVMPVDEEEVDEEEVDDDEVGTRH